MYRSHDPSSATPGTLVISCIIFLRFPEDKLKCEHICDTFVYECIIDCDHNTQCMRNCWIEHDRCAVNCPCNEECLDGCPVAYENHPCDTWFCQGYIEQCAAKDNANRVACPAMYENDCLAIGCCFVEYHGSQPGVPWCHYHLKE